MINVFVSAEDPTQLQVATRTQLGANGKFYSEKSFETLFENALAAMGLSRQSLLGIVGTPSESVPFRFASLLLQHPEHRVVARCRSPRLWLIHTGQTAVDGTVTIQENIDAHPRLAPPSYPMSGFLTEKDLDAFFSGLVDTKGWFWQGLVFKDGSGHRWRVRNPNYIYLRTLRGPEATNVERFLRLRSESKVTEYLKHYPEERQVFWELEQKLRSATQTVFQAYCEVHKSHEKKLADVVKPIQPCVFRLHSHFLEHLKPQNEKVQMKHAVELVNNMALFEQRRLLESPEAVAGAGAGAGAVAVAGAAVAVAGAGAVAVAIS